MGVFELSVLLLHHAASSTVNFTDDANLGMFICLPKLDPWMVKKKMPTKPGCIC